jgi:1-acyl-sn-glycerol-3-phosphate acyltransferase
LAAFVLDLSPADGEDPRPHLSSSAGHRPLLLRFVIALEPTTLAISAAAFVTLTLGYSWVVLPWLSNRLDSGPIDGFLLTLIEGWMRLLHRPRWFGFEKVQEVLEAAPGSPPKGAILVANHASGLDPFLLQVPIRRRLRWLMAQDQMLPTFAEAWEHLGILPVTYGAGDSATFREANRHVQAGGLLGLFPEGGIARPARQIRPFLAGVGLMAARAKVPVIVCWIEGAPETANATGAFFKRASVRVHCLEVIDFRGERDVEAITARLRNTIQRASGWPLNDEPMPWTAPTRNGKSPAGVVSKAATTSRVPSEG